MTDTVPAVVVTAPTELTVTDLVAQVGKIQAIMRAVMRQDEHFGVIPGTKKPTLLKPGAEKLGMTFRLCPRFRETVREAEGGHREYAIVCELYHVVSGAFCGEGVGTCSTMESKYRYRWENTGLSVPAAYWDTRDASLLGGATYVPRKQDGQWLIFHRVEHDNPADYYNTALKMAKKRAHVDAILTATAASDIFTQDMEDTPSAETPAPGTDDKAQPIAAPQRKSARAANGDVISQPQAKRMYAIYRQAGHADDTVRAWLLSAYGIEHSRDVQKADYEAICTRLADHAPLLPDRVADDAREEQPPWPE